MTTDELKGIFEMHQAMNIEVFYWWCIAIMFLIHAGFLSYEIGASRTKNAQHAWTSDHEEGECDGGE